MRVSPAPRPALLWLLVAVAIASISLASILIRLTDAPALAIATYRVTLASLVIAPYFARRYGRSAQQWSVKNLAVTLLSGLFLALHFAFWIRSLALTSVASSATLVSTTPLFVALFSTIALRERPGRRILLGIICTFLGSALVAGADFSFSPLALQGDALALAGALMASGYFIAGRAARRTLDLPAYTFGAYGMAALILLGLCGPTGTPLWGFTQKTYLALVLLALVPQLIGHTTFNWTLRFLTPTTVATLVLGEPIGATFLAYLFLGETITPVRALGLCILGAGIVLSAQATPDAPLPSSS